MLSEICKELNNWFDKKRLFGKFTISDGILLGVDMLNEQYFRIVGSVLNDGVYQFILDEHGAHNTIPPLKDESFDGAVWLMAVPSDVLKLDGEITAWLEQYSNAVLSPYQSESFGGYSYTKASGTSGSSNPNGASWQAIFGGRLNRWRKI